MKKQSVELDLGSLSHWEKLVMGLLVAEWWAQTGEMPHDMTPFLTEISRWTKKPGNVLRKALSPETTATVYEEHCMGEDERNLHRTLCPLPEDAHWSARWVVMWRCKALLDDFRQDCQKYTREAVLGVVKTVQRMKAEGRLSDVKKARWQYVYALSGVQVVKRDGGRYDKTVGPQVFARWVSWGMGCPGYLDKGHFAIGEEKLTDPEGIKFSNTFVETYNAIRMKKK